jgi:hypothetical protein
VIQKAIVQERRIYHRYEVRLSVEVHLPNGPVRGATHDLSSGGCRVESVRPLPEDKLLPIDLRVVIDDVQDADYPPLRAQGQVRWTAEGNSADGEPVYYSGIEFRGLTPSQANWIEKIIAANR